MAETAERRAMMQAGAELVRIQTKAKKMAIEHKEQIEQLVESSIITVGAGVYGFLDNRYPDRMQVAKIPVSGVVAVAALGTTLTGMIHDETTSKALMAFGQASAAAFAYQAAAKKGASMRQAAATTA